MSSTQENPEVIESKSYEKLARLYQLMHVAWRNGESRIEKLLVLDGDINYQVPNDSCLRFYKPHDIGNTALHIACQGLFETKFADLLLNCNADPTIKNNNDLSPIHQLIRSVYKNNLGYRDPFMIYGKLKSPVISLLLAAQVRYENSVNPRDPWGFSHFHAACMANDTAAVEFFLNNDVTIDEAVNVDSPMFPGYTPLHITARFGCVQVANVLLTRGANLFLKDSNGMTPVHLAIERNMSIVRYSNSHRDENVHGTRENELYGQVRNNEIIIASMLSKMDKATIGNLGLSAFYAMRTALKDAFLVEIDDDGDDDDDETQDNINELVDLTVWPGYTALHFAARLNVHTFELLAERGANVRAKDANGDTAFDMCIGTHDVKDIHALLSSSIIWREIVLTDGRTKLVDLVRAMRYSAAELASFLHGIHLEDINDISIPIDSLLWPGFTILHLAVILSKRRVDIKSTLQQRSYNDESKPNELLELCLRLGADVSAQDLHGSTPLHLAFRRLDTDSIHSLLNNHRGNSNPVDRDNVSHLHVACAMQSENLVRKLIDRVVEVNAAVSSTFRWNAEVQQCLREDCGGERYFIVCEGSTPLHIAVTVGNKAIVKMLMNAGANLDATNVYGLTPLHLLFKNTALGESIGEIFQSMLVLNDRVVNGLSYLHVATYGETEEAEKVVERLIQLGVDVNTAIVARNSSNSIEREIDKSNFNEEMSRDVSFLIDNFEGNTPLHLAVHSWRVNIPTVLMARGADVLAENAAGESPICSILIRDYLLKHYMSLMSDDEEKRVCDRMGVTRLHMACKLFDEKIIRDCVLRRGANVNAQIHEDSQIWSGYTPLHILVAFYDESEHSKRKICRITKLLLSNGADVTIADAKGETPLLLNIFENHIGERPPHIDILMKALKNTVVNPVSAQGISHFHLACIRNDVALVNKFLKLGVDVNQTVDYFSEICPGYTPLHFAACRECDWLRNDLPPLRTIHLLLKYGANVHALDAMDNTPLHIAAQYVSLFKLPYRRIVWAGADTRVQNFYGMTPANQLFQFIDEETWYNVSEMCLYGCGYPIRQLRRTIQRFINRRANRNCAK